MQKLLSTMPTDVQHMLSLATTYQDSITFYQGFQSGYECSADDRAEGQEMKTMSEVWDFLNNEISPRAIQRDIKVSTALNQQIIPPVLEQRIGFVVGYLTHMFTPHPHVVSLHATVSPRSTDCSGWPLDL